MDIRIRFPGGKRVDAQVGDHVIRTDQSPAHGGEGSAPAPFELFLTSLASCAGLYVLGFCAARNIPTQRIELIQHHTYDATGQRLERVELEVHLPADFPEKYRQAVIHAAASCRVKKLLQAPPEVVVSARDESGALLATTGKAA